MPGTARPAGFPRQGSSSAGRGGLQAHRSAMGELKDSICKSRNWLKVIDNISSNRIRRMDRTDGSAKEKDVAPETTFTPRQVESFHQHAGHLPALRRAGQTAPSLHVLWLLPGAPGQSPRKHCD